MTKPVQSQDIDATFTEEFESPTTALTNIEFTPSLTLYPGMDRADLTHEQRLAVHAYEERYREGITENLDDLRKKMPGTALGVTGIFLEEIEVQALDPRTQLPVFDELGKPVLEEKMHSIWRISAWRPTGANIIENEIYFSSTSPIVARKAQELMDEYNAGRMGDFECLIPVEVFNKLYRRSGHTGIGLKVVEEL